jgi:hypothetical protein
MAWVQGPSGLIKMEGSTSAFKSMECFMKTNINTRSKSLLDTNIEAGRDKLTARKVETELEGPPEKNTFYY